jgi:predicted MFS family arabinose efflux permease
VADTARPGDAPQHRLGAALALLAGVRLVLTSTERMVYPFLPTIARGLGVGLGPAGLLLSSRALGAVTAPLTVATAGRGRRHRRLLTTALVLFVAGAALVAVPGPYGLAVVGFAVLGAGRPAYDAAAQSYVAERVPFAVRGRRLAVLELTYSGGLLVGAPVAGWLIARGSWRTPFVTAAVLGIVAIGVAHLVLERHTPDGHARPERLRLDHRSWALLVVVTLFAAGAETTFVVFGAWLEDDFGLRLLALGAAAFVIGGAELVGEAVPLAVVDRLGKRRTVALGLVVSTVGFAAVGSADGVATGLATLAVALLGFEIAIVSTVPILSEVQPQARSRFLALAAVAMFGGRAVAAGVGPQLYVRGGVALASRTSAALMAAALAVVLLAVREPSSTT